VFCSSAQALEVPLLTGATGPTGPAGPEGKQGPTGPAGTGGGGNGEATNFGKYTGAGSSGGLASGKQESGVWAAHIQVPVGSEQDQAEGVASFPIPLKFHEKVKLQYRNATEALAAIAPCAGSPQEPVITTSGNFCAYRGSNSAGLKESGTGVGNVDKNAKFFAFEASNGDVITETGEAGDGDDGIAIVFRTTEFSTEEPIPLAEEAHLNALGSWAVAAK
jgi:hypothetical protein